MRIGFGYDSHRFADGEEDGQAAAQKLGGVPIPDCPKLAGHSDADVLIHAIIDALLGAAALGDIGKMFPDTDPETEGISSVVLLDEVAAAVAEAGFTVHNLDCTIIAQKPKLAAHLPRMRNVLAKTLDVPPDRINVKATTEEHMGFTGRAEGISAHAVVLLYEPGDR